MTAENADPKLKHVALTRVRAARYESLFGEEPDLVYPFHTFDSSPDAALIDILVYPLNLPEMSGRAVAAVTNGMSDQPMADGSRHELIQYFRECDEDHARRLYDLAWMPLFDGFTLKPFDTIALPDPVEPDSDLNNALFMPPIITKHREFFMMVEGVRTTLLWHVPISDAELAEKKAHGIESLVAKMQAAQLPWIFDEAERPRLL
jgi:hypothetical protein